MKSEQRIISQVRSILSTGRPTGDVDGAAVATEYARACVEANARLLQCKRYLSSGMNSEAMYIAEAKPVLLDLCAVLDFVGVEDWAPACNQNNWPLAERIDESAVTLLNEEYSSAFALEPVIKLYRKAVQEKNIRECIELLRKIQALDVGNTNWGKDLEAFEKKRHKEIQSLHEGAEKNNDSESLSAYLEELGEDWAVAPSPELRSSVRNAHRAVRQRQAKKAGAEIIKKISEAFSALEFTPLSEGIAKYERLLEEGYFEPHLNVSLQFNEANEWFNGEKSRRENERTFNRDLAALTAELGKSPPTEKVAQLWQRVDLHRRELPDGIPQRARAAIENHDLLVRRKKQRTVALIIAACFAVSATVLAGIWHRQLRIETAYWSQQYKVAFDAYDIGKFTKLNEEIPLFRRALFGRFLEHSDPIVSWSKRTDELRELIDKRNRNFSEQREVLQTFANQDFIGNSAQIETALQRANDLALTEEQKSYVEEFKQSWKTHSNKQIGAYIQALTLMMPTLDTFSTNTLPSIAEQITAVELSIENATAVEKASPASYLLLQPYESELQELELELGRRQKMLQNVSSAPELVHYVQAVEQYASEFPSDQFAQATVANRRVTAIQYETFLNVLLDHKKALNERQVHIREQWPKNQGSILGLRGNDSLCGLRYFGTRPGQISKPKTRFLKGELYDGETGTIRGYRCSGLVYVPSPTDHAAIFTEARFQVALTNSIYLMAHSKIMQDLLTKAETTAPEEAIWLLLDQLKTISATPVWDGTDIDMLDTSILNTYLKFMVTKFLVNMAVELVGEGWSPELDAALGEMNATEEPAVDWLCLMNAEVIDFDSKCRTILQEHFANCDWMLRKKITSEAREIVTKRGARWCGFLDPINPRKIEWRTQKVPREAWVLRTLDNGELALIVAFTNEDKRLRRMTQLKPYEPILAPVDDTTTPALLRHLCESVGAKDPSRVTDLLPSYWPRSEP